MGARSNAEDELRLLPCLPEQKSLTSNIEDAIFSYPIEKMNLKSNEYCLNDKHRILVHIHVRIPF